MKVTDRGKQCLIERNDNKNYLQNKMFTKNNKHFQKLQTIMYRKRYFNKKLKT